MEIMNSSPLEMNSFAARTLTPFASFQSGLYAILILTGVDRSFKYSSMM